NPSQIPEFQNSRFQVSEPGSQIPDTPSRDSALHDRTLFFSTRSNRLRLWNFEFTHNDIWSIRHAQYASTGVLVFPNGLAASRPSLRPSGLPGRAPSMW